MQPPPDASHISIGALIAQVGRQWRRALNRRLQSSGLTEATWLPLLYLYRAATPMRQKDLAAAIALESSSIVRLLDELQAAGLVERRESSDRRARDVHITRRGRQLAQEVEHLSSALREELLASIAPDDLETAEQVLRQLSTALTTDEAAS